MNDWIREFACLWENGESVEKKENDLNFGCDMECWVPGEKQDDANHIKTARGYYSCLPVEYNKENPLREQTASIQPRGLTAHITSFYWSQQYLNKKTGIFVAVS